MNLNFEWEATVKKVEQNSQNWVEKYKPTKIDNIIGNKSQIKQILDWLLLYDNKRKENKGKTKKTIKIKIDDVEDDIPELNGLNDPTDIEVENVSFDKKGKKNISDRSCMIVTGDHGTGKTCTVMAILNDKGYDINVINFSKINSIKNLGDYIDKLLRGNNVYNLITGKSKSKRVIVIDELESIISPNEKTFVTSILKQNEIEWGCPVIFIANNHHNKLITTIKTNSYEIKFFPPSYENMHQLMTKIKNNEKIIIDDPETESQIIEHCQNDFRRLVSVMQDIKALFPSFIITEQRFSEFAKLSKMKDIDHGIYKTTSKLMYDYNNIDSCLKLYETDKVLIPLMVHQNYIKTIIGNVGNMNKHKIANEVAVSLAKGDVIENYIYGDQNWNLHDVHGYYSCIYPSFTLSKVSSGGDYNKFDFPLDLNRTSIKRINKKNVINASRSFSNMDIPDYININKLVRGLISVNQADQCKKLFSGYNCNSSHIETLLKIDKIEGKYTVSGAVKKKL